MIDNKHLVLIVDDDLRMCKVISDFLSINGFKSLIATNGEEALEKYYENNKNIDIILLDIMMPKLNGYKVLEEIRQYSSVPIIMLTAKSEDSDQLLGFFKGTDDYITKPFSPSILLARIKSVLNRCMDKGDNILKYKNILINMSSRIITINEKEKPFTQKEFDLLTYFCKNKNIALSRDQILNAVWGFNYVGDIRTVDTHVKQLRIKIKKTPLVIKTVHGLGYILEENYENIN